MKKINKGFTLIELLIAIAIIAIIFTLGYFSVISIIDYSDNKSKKINENLIIDAGKQYAMEFKNQNGFTKYTNDDDVTKFCISLNTLSNYGIYNNNEVIKKYADEYVIYVTGENEVYDYKLLKINSLNNECVGLKFISEIKEGSEPNKIINIYEKNLDNQEFGLLDISYDLDIIETGKSKKKYVLNMDLKKYINTEIKNVTLPVYVSLVLDKSGSMSGSKYTNSKNASIELSKQLINKFGSNAYISLIQFGNMPEIKRDFENSILTDSIFSEIDNMTNVSGGIDFASKLFYNLKSKLGNEYDKVLKYTILLYDGIPNEYLLVGGLDNNNPSYYTNLFNNATITSKTSFNSISYVRNSSSYLKETIGSKLITIGYDFSGSNELKEISSNDINNTLCADSNYSGYCYYESTSSNINNLFEAIQNNISEEVNKTAASKAKVIIKLNSNITTEINNEKTNEIVYEIEFDNTEKVDEYMYNLIISEKIFNNCEKKDTCNIEVKLFDNIIIETYNKDGTLLTKTEDDSSPIFIIDNSTYSILQ